MLVLDSTIGCIEADESQVLVLHRSAPIVTTPAPGSRPASMEAYICAIRAKSQTKVHLALVADNRRIYVYLEAFKATDAAAIERSLQQALWTAKALGFSPEPVDLNYRPAMREVVLRNIKILRSPGSKGAAALRAGLPGAPILPLHIPEAAKHDKKVLHAPVKNAGSAPAVSAPKPAAILPSTASVAPTPAAPVAGGSPALSRGERSSVSVLQLEKELQLMAAERDALVAQLQQLSAVHQEVVMELTAQRDGAAMVTADLERLARVEEDLKATAAERASLTNEVRDLTAKLQESQRVAEEEKRVNGNLAAELAAANKEREALLSEREVLQKRTAAAAQAEKVSEENRALCGELEELNALREAELERLSSLEQDLFMLVAELGTATTEAAALRGELAAAVAGVATAEAELVVARSKVVAAEAKAAAVSRKLHATEVELDKARAELAAASKLTAVPEQADLSKEPAPPKQTPVQKIMLKEPERGLADELDNAFADLQQAPLALHSGENEADLRGAAPEDRPREDEIVSEAGSWYGADLLQFEPAPDAIETAGAGEDRAQEAPISPQAHDFPPFGELQDGFFSLSGDPAPVGHFVLRPDLEVIEYLEPEDVVELHQSINNANMSPDGKGQESCSGYICALKCGDKLQVFAAIYGTRSGRTSVYAPESQPEDEAGYAGVMRSAINFAEEVGLMMEPVKGGAADLQVDSIVQCPVLRKAA